MICLLGGSGYIGSAFREALDSLGLPYASPCRAEADGTNATALAAALVAIKPVFLINCAGYSGKPNVDECELHKTECLMGNAVLPGTVRQTCDALAIPWGHVSTGCIYSGSRTDGSGFTENDPPNFTFRQNNCSFYSGAKALGEEVLAGAASCYIWRLRIPFNNRDNPRNYLAKLLRYERLLDVRNSLSQLDEFARAAIECWQKRVPFGVYNMTNPGSVTTREVVELIAAGGLTTKRFQFFKDEEEFNRLAARTPRSHCVLDTRKLQQAGIRMTEIHEALAVALKNWKSP